MEFFRYQVNQHWNERGNIIKNSSGTVPSGKYSVQTDYIVEVIE